VILLSLALVLASLGLLIGGLAATSQVLVWASLLASLGACALLLLSVLSRRRGVVDLDADPDQSAPVPAVPLPHTIRGPPPRPRPRLPPRLPRSPPPPRPPRPPRQQQRHPAARPRHPPRP
jgi:hypothetical protein